MEVAPPNPERRSAPRHRMSVPVTFPGGTGLTRDVSSSGVYFLSESSFEEGQPVSLTLTLEHSSPKGPVDVTYQGVVTRTEVHGARTGAQALQGAAVALEPGANHGLGFAKAS